MRHIVFLFFALSLAACSSSRAPRFWDASSIANSPRPVASFLDKRKGKVVGRVNTADVRRLIYVKDRVEHAAGELRVGLLVADDNEPNAFSFAFHEQPIIAVNIGMINALGADEDAMAALLGHELAHLYLMHGKRRQSREENRILGSAALSFALGMIGIPAPVEATDIATTSISNTYSRDEEREADQFGVEFMAHAGFDPWGAVRLQEKLEASAKGPGLQFMSTHPANTERVENMKRLALETKPDKAPSLLEDWTVEPLTLPAMQ